MILRPRSRESGSASLRRCSRLCRTRPCICRCSTEICFPRHCSSLYHSTRVSYEALSTTATAPVTLVRGFRSSCGHTKRTHASSSSQVGMLRFSSASALDSLQLHYFLSYSRAGVFAPDLFKNPWPGGIAQSGLCRIPRLCQLPDLKFSAACFYVLSSQCAGWSGSP